MSNLTSSFWPTARHFAEAIQCPRLCFNEPSLREMLPAVDRLGMPLVTSGQFAYVFKLNSQQGTSSVAVRCFRGYLGDREQRYAALDSHLNSHTIHALPRFKYLPKGILVNGQRFPVLVMQWIEGPTLDVYLQEMHRKPDVVRHLADEWIKLVANLREAGVAHGDLQHGNIIVEHGQFRLVDFDGMFVPQLAGRQASEVGHQHYQHPQRDARLFSPEIDNFSALVIYLSLVALAARPELWDEHHDENLLFSKQDFLAPESSALLQKIKETGEEERRLAEALETAARGSDPLATPHLLDLVSVKSKSKLPAWMSAPVEIDYTGHTREVSRADAPVVEPRRAPRRSQQSSQAAMPQTPTSQSVQSIFNTPAAAASSASTLPAPLDPSDVWGNTVKYAGKLLGQSYFYVWWIPVYRILDGFWSLFGITDFPAVILTLLLFASLFLLYGFLRAVYESEKSLRTGQASAGSLAAMPVNFLTPNPPKPKPTLRGQASNAWFTQPKNVPLAVKGMGRPVVGNPSLRLYHMPECEWAEKIAKHQRVGFPTPADAYLAGYRPCKICDP
ncbi:MAG TPA: hypothetical protein VNA19_11840 [Pyrinomonadaceae bacterium]|jgi:serine/threonine protein kinase|nr:hypothetical protein [Pyrinomonadaceae bacterium]